MDPYQETYNAASNSELVTKITVAAWEIAVAESDNLLGQGAPPVTMSKSLAIKRALDMNVRNAGMLARIAATEGHTGGTDYTTIRAWMVSFWPKLEVLLGDIDPRGSK